MRLCADGGANRLYDVLKTPEQRKQHLPDEIIGDLDSLRSEVKEYYLSVGVKVTRVRDQDSTDFMKCVFLVEKSQRSLDLVVLSGLGGRFDQTMATINMLYYIKNKLQCQTVLVSDENITILLDQGTHTIQCSDLEAGPTCGLIPVGAPATITTEGLQWNLENRLSVFGGMVSSSNAIVRPTVTVHTDAPIVWTVEIKNPEI
ncbi:thiamine pyrophosphokinase 1-like protein [Spinellus fusiger]|nr:thiamine pyrophosphokinase 1-like protein [Spinellus fusiger]